MQSKQWKFAILIFASFPLLLLFTAVVVINTELLLAEWVERYAMRITQSRFVRFYGLIIAPNSNTFQLEIHYRNRSTDRIIRTIDMCILFTEVDNFCFHFVVAFHIDFNATRQNIIKQKVNKEWPLEITIKIKHRKTRFDKSFCRNSRANWVEMHFCFIVIWK